MSTDKAPQPGDTLGDRIKRYERASRPFLSPNTPAFIRVDGKAFHTWTKFLDKPFDRGMISAMQDATLFTARNMSGFKLAYTQSDEATFMITDTDRLESQPWLDYNVNKLVSITASMFTCYFNKAVNLHIGPAVAPAFFDARAFNVPEEDAANVFVWRQRDWERNSLSMLGHHVLGHGRMQNKKRDKVHDMLFEHGVNWTTLDPVLKNGTFVLRSGATLHNKIDYSDLDALIHAPGPEPACA